MADIEVKPGPVVKGTRQKKSLSVIVDMFFVESLDNIGNYILKEVVVPGIKGMIKDTFDKGMNMLLWGDSNVVNASNNSASNFHSAWSQRNGSSSGVAARRKYSYDPVITNTEDDARHLLDAMNKWIKDYSYITVDDMYYLAGIPNSGDNWTDAQWGWHSMQGVTYSPCRGGWQIRMPEPVPLDVRRR